MTLALAQRTTPTDAGRSNGLNRELIKTIANSIALRSANRCFPALDRDELKNKKMDESALRALPTRNNVFSLLELELVRRGKLPDIPDGTIGRIMICLGLSRSDLIVLVCNPDTPKPIPQTIKGVSVAERLLTLC